MEDLSAAEVYPADSHLSSRSCRRRRAPFPVVPVELGDEADADLLRAGRFAFVVVRAMAEAFGVMLPDHGEDAPVAFGLALRKIAEVADFGGDEQHGRGVRAGGDAGAAADAGGGVHRQLGCVLGDGHVVAVGAFRRC